MQPLLEKYRFGEDALDQRKAFLGITPRDEQAIGRLSDRFARFAPRLAEGFYEHLLAHRATAELLAEPGLLERLKAAQMAYFEELVSGHYGPEYFEKRLRVGEIHHAVGLDPQWYLGAYNQYVQLAFPFFAEQAGVKLPAELLALLKVIFLDIDLALHTYFAAAMERSRQQNEELRHAVDMYFQAELKAQQYAKLAGHEIRGALQSISAVCESVAEDYGELLPAEAVQSLATAQQRCLKTHSIVESILSQPERAGERTWVDARQIVSEVAARVGAYGDEGAIEFVGLEHSVRLWADPIGLREAVANLVANAVHYGDKTPVRIVVRYETAPKEHRFSVSDNGPGIPPSQLDKIFDPFFRGTGAQQPGRHRGRGLGLHFVKTIVHQHGGRIWAESKEGRGATFHFTIAKTPEEMAAEEK